MRESRARKQQAKCEQMFEQEVMLQQQATHIDEELSDSYHEMQVG